MALEPITRMEKIIAGKNLKPLTRQEKIIAGEDIAPITRLEWFLKNYIGGGGSDAPVGGLYDENDNLVASWEELGIDVSKNIPAIDVMTGTGDLASKKLNTYTNGVKLVIPEGITHIGEYSLYNCSVLTSIIVPNSVTSIGTGAFSMCSGVKTLIIGNGVTRIDELLFNGTINLTDIYYTGTEEEWNAIYVEDDDPSFNQLDGVTIHYNYVPDNGGGSGGMVVCKGNVCNAKEVLNSIEGIKVSCSDAAGISANAFANCTSLTEIDLPNVNNIGDSAFNSCTALADIYLPKCERIYNAVFMYCTSLKSIDLPRTIEVGENVFNGCTSLSAIILRNNAGCNFNVFGIVNTKILTAEGMPTGEGFIYVPTARYEQYVANFTEQAMGLGVDEATGNYIATAILRKIEDYPEICG